MTLNCATRRLQSESDTWLYFDCSSSRDVIWNECIVILEFRIFWLAGWRGARRNICCQCKQTVARLFSAEEEQKVKEKTGCMIGFFSDKFYVYGDSRLCLQLVILYNCSAISILSNLLLKVMIISKDFVICLRNLRGWFIAWAIRQWFLAMVCLTALKNHSGIKIRIMVILTAWSWIFR